MKVRPIRSDADYQAALARISELMEAADEVDVLKVIVADYESRHYPIEFPTALDALKFRMEQQGLQQADLVPYLGSRAKVSEVLAGKRRLSLTMRKRLLGLGIPASVLLQ